MRVTLWRLVPWRAQAAPREPGGALWFPRALQGLGRHDNPDRYGCLYASEAAASAVAEALAPFRGTAVLAPEMLVRADLPLALARLDLDDPGRLVDLDDPRVLSTRGLRPSGVATRARALTQGYAARVFDELPQAVGLRWWSTLEASLINLTLYDRAAPHLSVVDIKGLTVGHAAVVEAAEMLGLAAERRS
ncbi:MAG: RES domain-containing protein [Solirubrobacterales bacterium]